MRVRKSLWLLPLLVLSCVFILTASIPNVATGTWQTWNPMGEVRSGAAAVLLQDGRVLMTGGNNANGPVASADLFGTDGNFSAAAVMQSPRSGHTATVLSDGRVLVAGGTTSGGGITNSAEIYDPSANSWTLLSSTMVDARSGHTASLLPDGRVLLAGGQNSGGAIKGLEIFDPSSGKFSGAGVMTSARMNHAAASLQDGRVLLVGGSDGTNPLASVDVFDPSAGSVSAGPNLSSPRVSASATTTLDGKVAVIGGNNGASSGPVDLATADILVADPATGQLSSSLSASHLLTPRSGHQSFLLPKNNAILVIGGSSSGTDLNSAELYSPWADSFQATGSMSVPRPGFVGSAIGQDGVFLAAGGTNLSSTELYGFATVKTDAADYPPGSTVTITGSGWQPGETVTLTLLEAPLIDTPPTMTAVADAFGNISNNQFSPDVYDANVRFYLTAAGNQSGFQAQNTFTDSVTSVTITSVTPTTTITALPASVTVSFNYLTSTTGTTNGTADLLGLSVFSNSKSLTPGSGSDSITINIPTGATNGTYNVKVTVNNSTGTGANNKNDQKNGAIVISVPTCTAPTVTAQPVNQTVTSGVASVSFSAAASGSPAPTVQWQVSSNGGATWANLIDGIGGVNGSTTGALSLTTPSASLTGNQYRAVFTNICGGTQTAISNVAALTVNKADTTTTITSDSPDPSVVGQPVTINYSVTVQAPGSGIPTGNVTVSDGTVSCSATVAAGTCSLTFTSAGAKTLTASYAGDTNFNNSSSVNEPHTVNRAATTSMAVSSVNPSVFGQSVTFTATIAVVAPGAGTPTGTVDFKDGTTTIASAVPLSGSQATFSISSLAVATHTITAIYSGNTNFNGSTSAGLSQVVNKADTTTTITSDGPDPSLVGQSVMVNYSVVAKAPGNGTATGNVTVSDGTVSCTATVAVGGCSLIFNSVGSKTLTASYAGDTNFNSSTSVNESHTVQYNVCLLYDPTRSVKSGATYPLKLYLCDVNGNDVSSSGIIVHATSVVMISGVTGTPEDAGNANPDSDFRFDSTLGPSGGYIFNLQTTGLTGGTYGFTFTASNDPATHKVLPGFGVK